MARVVANEAMVLLKNDGTLPLKKGKFKLAVIGPLADQTRYLVGNYAGTPSHSVSSARRPEGGISPAEINFVPGTQFLAMMATRFLPRLSPPRMGSRA